MRFWGDFALGHGFALPLTLALRMVHYRERTQGQDCAGITRQGGEIKKINITVLQI